MRDQILFSVNGSEHRVGGSSAFATLANWLRYEEGATGTKTVCEEGDCGACTVLVRRSAKDDFVPVNSCILSIAQMDGASIITVEGLKNGSELNAVQQSMVTCHGAQCGYCTPGFIVAMSAMFENCDRVDEQQTRDGLTGNLCRCTGYEPIIKAALAVDVAGVPKLRERYLDVPSAPDATKIEGGGRLFFAPVTMAEATAFKRDHQPCTIVQGGTDVGVWVNKRAFAPPAMLFLGKIEGLSELRDARDGIVAGANVSLAKFEAFIRERIPELAKILAIFGSPQIKWAGTLAGNIANGSPIADTLPYLYVAGAELELTGTAGARLVPIDRFYLGYKKFDLKPDEIITRIRIPAVHDLVKLYKVSRRKDLDISAFTAAIRLSFENGLIAAPKIVYGGVGPTLLRLTETEAFLTGKQPKLATFEQAGAIARGEIKPISDVRGSADYRLQLAENILSKFWFETFGAASERQAQSASR
ncbi:MAG: FAD binding domain-containing protein [Thermoanaerobaculia bacterium]